MDTSGMSEEELQFHYFKMHDADNNNKLDGLELVASLQHWHDEETVHAEAPPQLAEWKLAEMVDMSLLDVDTDKDGYISWVEMVTASNRI